MAEKVNWNYLKGYFVCPSYQPKLDMGLSIHFDTEELDGFVEWKQEIFFGTRLMLLFM